MGWWLIQCNTVSGEDARRYVFMGWWRRAVYNAILCQGRIVQYDDMCKWDGGDER